MATSNSPRNGSTDLEPTRPSNVEAQHPSAAPPPLPFAPPPPHIETAATSSSKPIWHNGHLLYLDPLSPSVIPKIIQILSKFTYNNPPRRTTVLSEATHIVIDPTSPFVDAVLQLRRAQHPPPSSASRPSQLLVTDAWLKECIFWEEWVDEADFLFVREGKKEVETGKKTVGAGGGGMKGKAVERAEVEMEEPEEDEMGSDGDESDGSRITNLGRESGTATSNMSRVVKPSVTTKKMLAASQGRRKVAAQFACPIPGCGSTFTRAFNLKGHLRSHTNERPFKCETCGKSFARQNDCKRHMDLHVGPQPHTYQGCQRKFSRLDSLAQHLKSQAGKGWV